MKILVLNCGSSSIKYKLFDMTTKEVIAQGGIEKIGLKGSFLKLTLPNGEKKILEKDIPAHTVGVEFILNTLINPEYGAIKSLDEINAVGHRMVHGGERFSESVLLNKEVLDAFIACNDLAPLHNPANLKGVNAVSAILPNVPQVGVFDTAFHQTMPDYAYMYAIPYELYEKYGVRRYGFHGTSHRYVSQRVCEFLGVDPKGKKIITCHIGNGGSIAAIKDGACIVTDTHMAESGINKRVLSRYGGEVFCFISDEDVAATAKANGTTRATASMDKAAAMGKKLIFAIGNAPTALVRLYELIEDGKLDPELIIGVPVGFVNVVQSKELIMQADVPYIVARGRKGGSNVAACICNALLYMIDNNRGY